MKKIISMVLALSICLGMLCMTASASEPTVSMQNTAEALKSLTLFRGSDKGFELNRAPTRMEAVIMLIRLLGKESAIYGDENGNPYVHPFTDAPGWQDANEYLGYAYATGMTNGTSQTTFDPNAPASAQMLVTFTLRALGYTDKSDAKLWDVWYEKANELDLGTEYLNADVFTRGCAVMLYWDALKAQVSGTDMTLCEKLVSEYVFEETAMARAEKILKGEVDLETSDLDTIMTALYAKLPTDLSHMRTMNMPVDADSAEYYLGSSDIKFEEALASEPMMLAQAHSVVLVRMEKASQTEAAMKTMVESVNPRKWICVGVDPETGIKAVASGDLIMLVMNNNYSQQFVDTFLSMAK